MRRKIHTRIGNSLSEGSTWAALAASFGTTATQFPSPFNTGLFVAAGIATIVAILLKDKGPT